MKPIRDVFSFIIEDFKEDYRFLKDVHSGKRKIDLNKVDFSQFDLKKMLKECWLWYLIIILAFFCGAFVSSQHFQDACNTYIQEEVIPQCNSWGTGARGDPQWEYIGDGSAPWEPQFNQNPAPKRTITST